MLVKIAILSHGLIHNTKVILSRFIVIHTGIHHTGAIIHAWKRHGCNLIEIYALVLLQKLEVILQYSL